MDEEIKDWLENEYAEFEGKYFHYEKAWRMPARALEGTELYGLFQKFVGAFPDHPSDINTVFYLTESITTTPVMQRVYLWCSHFEHSTLEDLRNLAVFMDEVLRALTTSEESAFVEILDDSRETVLLSFCHPKDAVAELFKSRGVQVAGF